MPIRPRRSRRSSQRWSRLRAKCSSAFRTLPAAATLWPFRPRSAGFAAPTRNRSALHGSLHRGAGFPGWHPCQARESGAPVSAFSQEPPRDNTLKRETLLFKIYLTTAQWYNDRHWRKLLLERAEKRTGIQNWGSALWRVEDRRPRQNVNSYLRAHFDRP